MPCRNNFSKINTTTSYEENLDVIGEIVTKHSTTHNIILVGDFNASLTRRTETSQDKKLKEFIQEHSFIHLLGSDDHPTFYHHNGKDTAQLDYIFLKSKHPTSLNNQENIYKIHPMHPLNTSDHTTVSIHIGITNNAVPNTSIYKDHGKAVNMQRTFQKPKWNKCDRNTYRTSVETLLKEEKLNIDQDSNGLLGLEISKLENILLKATTTAIEGHHTYSKVRKPRGKGKWNKEIADASKKSKDIHRKIKSSQHCSQKLIQEQKEAKRHLRKLQRKEAYIERETLYQDIMQAEKEDQQLFYKLINKQRSSQQGTTKLIVLDDQELITQDDIIEGWQLHFEKLATPSQSTTSNKEHEDQVNLNDLLIKQLCEDIKEPIIPISHEEVSAAIRSLNKNKAPDAYGITAEHIHIAEDVLLPHITTCINKIIEMGAMPEHLKEGVLTPVLKKGKDKRLPSNYRGITVTTTVSKILEHTLQERLNKQLDPTQNKLQRGFTAKTSPLNAAFMVSEAIAEKTDYKENVALVTLDAEKAYDRVWHERLFSKIYLDGIQGTLWLLLRDMQANATSRVKWENALSNPFRTLQGIRQGAKLSTTLYKRYNNNVLQQIEDNNLGTSIGTTNIGAPTVADDISMLPTTPLDTQVMLHTVSHNAELDKVNFNATKNELIVYGNHKEEEQ
ncbi:hypothetical protein FSP39_005046 [Pinctada imbricata]|uniref:Reverse transcriptase domain-containing protein n=1 Tax=Pinctada imbricata TaxID=66713 RepID=A0AA88Y1C4_PINIB|nr:hypothetical protein FSP39_005046 [Pinctada imbricata]